MQQMFQSSNPALAAAEKDSFKQFYGEMAQSRPDTATLAGVVNKTTILVLIAVVAGALAYSFIRVSAGALTISALASMGICFGFGIVLCRNPRISSVLGPIYAAVEGVFLGLLTSALDQWVAALLTKETAEGAAAAAPMSLALPAMLITVGVTVSMLALYYLRILKPTRMFKSIVLTAVGGIMITYLISWPLAMFGVQIPFLSLNSALQGGTPALIGLGLSVLILGVASLMLIIDFGRVEAIINSGQPRHMEWFAAFGLLVTLAWIYYEAVKLAFRLYLIFGARD